MPEPEPEESDRPILVDQVSVPTDEGDIEALLVRPRAQGPYPGVVVGAEATGVNSFIRAVAGRLASHGLVVLVPDYYRGAGPPDPEDYDNVPAIHAAIDRLDFRRATEDLRYGVDYVAGLHGVGGRVATWGYCTGATLAWLVACLDRDLAASVLFYPSQPVFPQLDARRPAHAMDLIWNLHCPVTIFYGSQDHVMPPERREELVRRLEQWDTRHVLKVYDGAGHVFAGHFLDSYREEADADSWQRGLSWLDAYLERHAPRRVPAAVPFPAR